MKTSSSCERLSEHTLHAAATTSGVIVGIAAVALFLACSPHEQQLREVRAEVNRALAIGDLDAARAALEDLRKSRPDTPEDVQQAASLMVRTGEAAQALWLLEDSLQRFPERHDLRLLFARVALMLGENSRALAKLEPIDSGSLFHPDALVLRAQATLELGDLERALAILREADELYPDLPAARRVYVQVLFQERRFDEALELIDEALERADSDAERRELRIQEARARGANGDPAEAVVMLLEVAQEDPAGFGEWRLLVQGMTGLDRRDEALALLGEALEEDPQRLGLYSVLADIHEQAGEREQAEEVLRRLIEVSPSPSAYMQLVRFHRGAGETEQAVAIIDEALEGFPRQPMLQSARATALIELRRIEEVRALLEEMEGAEGVGVQLELEYLRARLQLAEGDAEGAAERLRELVPKLDRADTQFYLGRSLEELGDLGGAERAYTFSRRHAPAAPEPVLAILRLAEKRKDPAGKNALAQQLLRFPEQRTIAFHVLVESLLELARPDRAEEFARQFVEEEPETLDAHLLLARALRDQGRTEEAEQVLDEAREKLGPSPEITADRALVLAVTDRTGDGIAAVQRALEESPDDPDLIRQLAALYFEEKQFEKGSALVDRALELDPEDLAPLRLRAVYTAVNGPFDAARRDSERYLEADPLDHEIHFRLGSVYARLGLTDEAVASYRRSAELAQGAYAPRNNLAVIFQESGDLKSALEFAHQAYALAETNPDVLDTLGWIYYEKGLLDRAISVLKDAHDEAPGGLGSLHLALAYREAGRAEEAQTLLSELAARSDTNPDIRRQAQDALQTLHP